MKTLTKPFQQLKKAPRWLILWLLGTFVVFATSLITQMVLFPDNPIYLRAGEYVGKYGAPHTKAEFETFTLINRVILVSGLGLFVGFFLSIVLIPAATTSDSEQT